MNEKNKPSDKIVAAAKATIFCLIIVAVWGVMWFLSFVFGAEASLAFALLLLAWVMLYSWMVWLKPWLDGDD